MDSSMKSPDFVTKLIVSDDVVDEDSSIVKSDSSILKSAGIVGEESSIDDSVTKLIESDGVVDEDSSIVKSDSVGGEECCYLSVKSGEEVDDDSSILKSAALVDDSGVEDVKSGDDSMIEGVKSGSEGGSIDDVSEGEEEEGFIRGGTKSEYFLLELLNRDPGSNLSMEYAYERYSTLYGPFFASKEAMRSKLEELGLRFLHNDQYVKSFPDPEKRLKIESEVDRDIFYESQTLCHTLDSVADPVDLQPFVKLVQEFLRNQNREPFPTDVPLQKRFSPGTVTEFNLLFMLSHGDYTEATYPLLFSKWLTIYGDGHYAHDQEFSAKIAELKLRYIQNLDNIITPNNTKTDFQVFMLSDEIWGKSYHVDVMTPPCAEGETEREGLVRTVEAIQNAPRN